MSSKRKRTADRKVLSYHDVVLRQQDVELLHGPYWLNDQVISFFWEYLSHEHAPKLCQGSTPKLVLLPPATTFLAASCSPEDAASILAPLKLDQCEMAMFPVNDNQDVEQANGGSHWSLLVYDAHTHTLRHYDSGGLDANVSAARSLADSLKVCLGKALPPKLVPVSDMPRQANGYDCGVYVCALAEALVDWFCSISDSTDSQDVKGVCTWEPGLGSLLTPTHIEAARKRILDLIGERQKRQQQP